MRMLKIHISRFLWLCNQNTQNLQKIMYEKILKRKMKKKNYSDRRLHDFTSWNISISKLVLKQKKIKKNKEGETREKRDVFKL